MIQVDGIFVQGGGGPVFPEFTYTGDYYIVNEGTPDWKIYFTSSGTFTPASNIAVQVQAIGGGSGGNGGSYSGGFGSGGGGGTSFVSEVILEASTSYPIVIGSGGRGGSARELGASGGTTSAFGINALGGNPGIYVDVFEFDDTSSIRQSGSGGKGGRNSAGSNGQNAGSIDPNIGGGIGGNPGYSGSNGNYGSIGGVGYSAGASYSSGGGGGGGGYGGGGGGGATTTYSSSSGGAGGAGAPGVIIMRNTRVSA